MSGWDGYLAEHVVGAHFDKAIIIDQTGQAIWGKSDETTLSPEEMNQIAYAFNDPSNAQEHGIRLEGQKYFYNKIEELSPKDSPVKVPVMHCAKGKEGILAAKCSTSILVTHYPVTGVPPIEHIVPQAAHLISNNL